uniref:C-type lectin domain-containing protein n=1 Tax=Seriola dumerili TaxID=41447 RepID=A0A3B4UNW4_SERDU
MIQSCHSLRKLDALRAMEEIYVNVEDIKPSISQTAETIQQSHTNQTSIIICGVKKSLIENTDIKKTCPAGWRMFSCTCYFLSTQSGSWEKAREDCRARGADLVIIDSPEEQTFLSGFISTSETWIGLSDREEEGVWKWVDGTPLNLTYWAVKQPDNGGGDPKWGEEDCAHLGHDGSAHLTHDESAHWNDLLCGSLLRWICEEMA